MLKKHLFSSDEKLKKFGYGELVEEADEASFTYKGLRCLIERIMVAENEEFCFGGHLCGYVRLPDNHPWIDIDIIDVNTNVYGGITFSDENEDGYWVGFDCAHSMDIVPSMQLDKAIKKLRQKYPKFHLPNPNYKNIKFVEEECKKLVDEIRKAEFSLEKN